MHRNRQQQRLDTFIRVQEPDYKRLKEKERLELARPSGQVPQEAEGDQGKQEDSEDDFIIPKRLEHPLRETAAERRLRLEESLQVDRDTYDGPPILGTQFVYEENDSQASGMFNYSEGVEGIDH